MREYEKRENYEASFGIYPPDKDKLEAAWKKAWECRDYEIDKFWIRAAYFWAFIALIGTGYIVVAIGKIPGGGMGFPLDFLLIALGLVFAVAWLLVIKGSKCHQENWEEHIYKMEDAITGPLYKTLYKDKRWYFSVTRINEILAWVVIAAWGILGIGQFLLSILKSMSITAAFFSTPCFKGFVLLFALLVVVILICRGRSQGINTHKVNKESGFFIELKM
jgi:hypothetical protein